MADIKVSELPVLTNVDEGDFVLVNDVSAATTKKITRERLLAGITRNVTDSGNDTIVKEDLTVNNELKVGGDIFMTGDLSFGSLTDYVRGTKITKIVTSDQSIVNNDSDAYLPTTAAVRQYIDLLVDSVYVGEINSLLSTATVLPTPNTIAFRDSAGHLTAISPSADNDVVNLKYFRDNSLQIGEYGIGADSSPTVLSLNNTITSGFYGYAGIDISNPSLSSRPGAFQVLRVADSDLIQVAYDQTNNGKYSRYSDNNGATWSAWLQDWTTGNLTKTVNATDNTNGRVVTVDGVEGWFGLGATTAPSLVSDSAAKVSASGFYSTAGITLDDGSQHFGSAVKINRSSNDVGSLLFFDAGGAIGENSFSLKGQTTSGNSGDWGELVEFYHTGNLDFVDSALDELATPNETIMTVGFRGLGEPVDLRGTFYESGIPSDVYGTGLTQGLASSIELDIANTFNNVQSLGTLVVQSQWVNTSAGAGAASRYFIGRDNLNDNVRIFWQTNLNDGVWSEWVEQWTSDNLVKTTSTTDTTAGRITKVGDWGLGADAANGIIESTDMNNLRNNGFFRIGAAADNRPLPFNIRNTSAFVLAGGFSTRATQFSTDEASQLNHVYVRQDNGNGYGAWDRFLIEDDVVSTPTDTSANKLLTTGSFGLGGFSLPKIGSFDDSKPTGFYGTLGYEVGAPINSSIHNILHMRTGTNVAGQIVVRGTDNDDIRMWIRGTNNYTGGVFTNWAEVYHVENPNYGVTRSSVASLGRLGKVTDVNFSATSGSNTVSINGSNYNEQDVIFATKERLASEIIINSSNGRFVYEDGIVDTQLVLNTGWAGTVKIVYSSSNFRVTVMG